jgi:hypothetical protein
MPRKARIDAPGAAVETAASLITMPVNLGADIATSTLLKGEFKLQVHHE